MKRRFRLVAVASLAVIAAAGCSSDSDPCPDPVGVAICVHLQDVAMEITHEWVDALERYDVTIEGWERSPDSPFGAGEAGDRVERREALVERIANEDWRRCVLRRSRASRAWVAVQSSGNRLVADVSIDPENCVSVNTNISEA